MVREMVAGDSSMVLEIYKLGIDSGISTFETIVPSWEEWDAKHYQHSRFVYQSEDRVVGWIAISPTSIRNVYRGVAEVSIYIHPNYHKKGIGSFLMQSLIQSSEEKDIWTLVSSVFPENLPTLMLHRKFGFRVVGYRERIAQLKGVWKDTIILERRSKIVS